MISLAMALMSYGVGVGPPEADRAPVHVCHSMDSAGASVLAWVRSVATDKQGAKQRTIMRLPLVAKHAVSYVTDERICRSALKEYNRYSGTRDPTSGAASSASEQVCVIRVGQVYAVADPNERYGEFIIFVTM